MDLLPVLLTILICIFIGVVIINNYTSKRKCTKCGSFIYTFKVDDINLGDNFKNYNQQDFMTFYKCKKCGNTWTKYETESFDGESSNRIDKLF